jgi:hypothetical protein
MSLFTLILFLDFDTDGFLQSFNILGTFIAGATLPQLAFIAYEKLRNFILNRGDLGDLKDLKLKSADDYQYEFYNDSLPSQDEVDYETRKDRFYKIALYASIIVILGCVCYYKWDVISEFVKGYNVGPG